MIASCARAIRSAGSLVAFATIATGFVLSAIVAGVASAEPNRCLDNGLASNKVDLQSLSLNPHKKFEFSGSRVDAIPGDNVQYTSTVANDGSTLFVAGSVKAAHNSNSAGRIASYIVYIEYFTESTGEWTPLAGRQGQIGGYSPAHPSPVNDRLSLDFGTPSVCGTAFIAGPTPLATSIEPHSDVTWPIGMTVELSSTETIQLLDNAQTSDIRSVVRFEYESPIDGGRSNAGPIAKSSFTDLLDKQTGDLRNVEIDVDLSDGRRSIHTYPVIHQAQTVTAQDNYVLPVEPPRSFIEDEDAYSDRLETRDEIPYDAVAQSTAIIDGVADYVGGPGNSTTVQLGAERRLDRGPLSWRAVRHLPLLGLSVDAPSEVVRGQTAVFLGSLQNDGTARAFSRVSAAVASTPLGSSPAEAVVDPDGTVTAALTYPVAWDHPLGAIEVNSTLVWFDANGNPYGPTSDLSSTEVTDLATDTCSVDADTLGVAGHAGMAPINETLATFTFADPAAPGEIVAALPAGTHPTSAIEETSIASGDVHSSGIGFVNGISPAANLAIFHSEVADTINTLIDQYTAERADESSLRARRLIDKDIRRLEQRRDYYESMGGIPIKSIAIPHVPATTNHLLATFNNLSNVEIGQPSDCASVGANTLTTFTALRTSSAPVHAAGDLEVPDEQDVEAGTYSPPVIRLTADARGTGTNKIMARWSWGSRSNWKYWRQRARRVPQGRGFELQVELGNPGRPFGFPSWDDDNPNNASPSVWEANVLARCAYPDDYAYDELSDGYSLTVGFGGHPGRKCRPKPPNGSRKYWWSHTLNEGNEQDSIFPSIQTTHYAQADHELADAFKQLAGEILPFKPDNESEYCDGRDKAPGSCMFGDHGVAIKRYDDERLFPAPGTRRTKVFEK